ncbi:hypothetical protein ACFQAV_08885 [Companilactobacillus huachuanensis]|uniref:DUF5590 domain-containing protein n=1 Tax=Companilactobacillus huachuanensis TaxID=2559914 RepID=A0ABW1RLI0_9LACO|nr:hypothetical protein [Companilactobacillus huachuanensis]
MKGKGNKIVITVVLATLVFFGIYKYNTRMPKGTTSKDQIMEKMSYSIDTLFGIDMQYNSDRFSEDVNEYRIFIYKNERTKRFVFPIRDKNTGKTHYCYLASYVSTTGYETKMATDIDHDNWSRMIEKRVASIENDNPAKKDYQYTISNYYLYYSGISEEWLNDELKYDN